MSAGRILVLMGGLLMLSCGRSDEPLGAVLTGYVDVFRSEGEVYFAFDPDRSPAILLDGGQGELTVRGVAGSESYELPYERRETGDGRPRIVVTGPLELRGLGVLVVTTGERAARWPVLWLPQEREVQGVHPWCPYARLRRRVREGTVAYKAGARLEAIQGWSEAAQLAESMGHVGEQAARELAIAFVYLRELELEQALAHASSALAVAERNGDGLSTARAHYTLGAIAKAAHEYRRAEAHLRRARRLASRLDARTEAFAAADYLALTLAELGRFEEAQAIQRQIAPDPDAPAHLQVAASSNHASLVLAAHQSGYPGFDLDDAKHAFELALALLKDDPQEEANLRAELALTELARGAPELARAALAPILTRSVDTLGPARWVRRPIEARIALASGDAVRASAIAQEFLRETEASPPAARGARLMALGLLGAAQLQMGDSRGLEHLEEAVEGAEAMALTRAMPRARVAVYLQSRRWYDLLVRSLVLRGSHREAWQASDRPVAGLLARLLLDARVEEGNPAWREYVGLRRRRDAGLESCRMVAAEGRPQCREEVRLLEAQMVERLSDLFPKKDRIELPAAVAPSDLLGPGEALLARYRFLDAGVVTFFVTPRRVRAHQEDDPLAGLEDEVLGLMRLYVVPGADAAAFNLPVRSVHGRPLAERLDIAFLPTAAVLALSEPSTGGDEDLIVADPDGSLPKSRAQATQLAAQILGRALVGDEAQIDAVGQALSRSRTATFLTHARMLTAEPWSSHLALAQQDELTVYDIVVRRRRDLRVILGGCTTGPKAPAHQFGLPQAFIVAGADAVLASVEPTFDGETEQLFSDLFRLGWSDRDPARAWRGAVAAAEARGDPSWRRFRLYGRGRSKSHN